MSHPPPFRERAPGMKLILVYKAAKAPVMLALAAWLTFAPGQATRLAHRLAQDLADGGILLHWLGIWLREHVSGPLVADARWIAWLDGFTTALEGFLLYLGKPWGEWLVVAGLAVLIPFEVVALVHHPSPGRLVVLLVNLAVVAYLARRRLRAHPVGGPLPQ